MITYIKGDLFEAIKLINYPAVLPHVCNNKGSMGAGFARSLKERYPIVMKDYRDERYHHLGALSCVKITEFITVINMVAQTLGEQRPLYYNYLSKCMDYVAVYCKQERIINIIAPMFGSGLSGGNWNVVKELIVDCWIRQNLNVTIYYL
jgi:O-acetyl-ADP-ribose deacetylase (regulator of RNase III)